MVSRRLWFPDEELKADRVSQAQKMMGDAFKGVKDAAGAAQKTVQQQFEEDRLGWAQKQMEQAFSNLRQAPQPQQPEPMPEPEPAPAPEATPSAAPMSTDVSTPSAPAPMGQVHFGPTPGVDIPDDEPVSSTSSTTPETNLFQPKGPEGFGAKPVTPLGPAPTTPMDGAPTTELLGGLGGSSLTDKLGKAKSLLGDTFQGIKDTVGDTASGLGTKVNDLGFRAPGTDSNGILGNTGLGQGVRAANQWGQDVMPTPKELSEPTGLLGEQGPLMKSLDPDVGNDPNLAGLKLGLETSGYPAQAKGAVRTGRDWMQSLDKIGTGADKLTGADSTLQERGAGAADLGMGAIGAFAPQFTYIGNVAAERAKELGYDDDKAETIGAVVGFLTPGGGAEQLGKAGAYANRTLGAGSRIGRLGGLAEDFARTTGNIGESAEDLAKVGRFRSLAPAAAMGVAAPIGGVMGARAAAEKDGASAGDIALGGLGGAFRAADIAGGVGEMGLGAGAKGISALRNLPGAARRVGSALRDGDGAAVTDRIAQLNATRDGATAVDGRPTRGLKLDAAGEVLGGIAGAQLTSQGELAEQLIDDENDPNARLKRAGLGALGFAVGSQAGGTLRKNARTFQRVADAFRSGEAPVGRERVIPPAAARALTVNERPNDFEWGRKSGFMPNRMDIAHSIRNTKGARLFPDGTLEVEQWRWGKPRRELGETGRGGVFYAATEEQANMYNSGDQAGEGGNVQYKGPTALRNVLFVDETGSMGRDIGSAFLGKAGYETAERELDRLLRGTDDESLQRAAERFTEVGWQPDEARKIAESLRQQRSRHGTSYALPESIASGMLRSNGYEAAVGVNRAQDGRNVRLGEIFDVRESAYPGQGPNDYRVQPEFTGATPRSLVPGRPRDSSLKQIARASAEGRLPKGMDSKDALRDEAVLQHLGLDGPTYDQLPQQAKMVLDRHLFDEDADRSVPTRSLVNTLLTNTKGGEPTQRWSSQAAYEGQQSTTGMTSQEYKKASKAPSGTETYLADIGTNVSDKGINYNPSTGKYESIDPVTGEIIQNSSYFSAELNFLKNNPGLLPEQVPKASDLQQKADQLGSQSPGVPTPGVPATENPPITQVNSYEDAKAKFDTLPVGAIMHDVNDDMYWIKASNALDDTLVAYDLEGAHIAAGTVNPLIPKTGVFSPEEQHFGAVAVADTADFKDVHSVYSPGTVLFNEETGKYYVTDSQGAENTLSFPYPDKETALHTAWQMKSGKWDTTDFPKNPDFVDVPIEDKPWLNGEGWIPDSALAPDAVAGVHYVDNTAAMQGQWAKYAIGDVIFDPETDSYWVKTNDAPQDAPLYKEASQAQEVGSFLKAEEAKLDEESALEAAAKNLFGKSDEDLEAQVAYALGKGAPGDAEAIAAADAKLEKGIFTEDDAASLGDNWGAYKPGNVIYNTKSGNYIVKTGDDPNDKMIFSDEYGALGYAEPYKAPAEATAPDWTKPVEMAESDIAPGFWKGAPPGGIVFNTDSGNYLIKVGENTADQPDGDWDVAQSEMGANKAAQKGKAQNPSFWQKLKAGFKAFGNDEAGVLGVRRAGGDEAQRGPFGAPPARTPEEIHAEQETLRRVKPSPAAQRQRETVAEAGAINEQGGTGQGATNPEVRATGPTSPGNLPKIRQRSGNPAGGPHTPGWDEATMGTKPASEFDDDKVAIPPVEALAARDEPITMADAQAIMSRQAADVRREEMVVSEMDDLPAEVKAQIKSLGYLKKRLAGMQAALPAQQQAVRELAERNAAAQGETAAGLATNVKREANRTGRRAVNRAAREEADRAAVFGEGDGVEGATDVDAVAAAGGKVQETEAGDRVVDAEGKVVAARTPAEVDLDGKPTTTTRPTNTTRDLTPEGGVAPGGVVEPGGTVEAGGVVGAGATVKAGATVEEGATVQKGAIIRPGATAAPGMLRAPVHKVTTVTTPATPGVPAITTTTSSVSPKAPRTPKAAAPGTTPAPPLPPTPTTPRTPRTPKTGTPKPPKTPKTPKTVTPPTPQPQMADTGWFDARGKLKPLDQLEGAFRQQLEGDYAKWEQYQAKHAATKGDAAKAQVTADYEASVEKMKATRAAQISGLSEKEILDLSTKEVWVRQLMDRSTAYGATGANQEYSGRDFATNYARANLIGANPITMARNAVGGVASLVWHPIEAAGAAVVDPIAAWRLARKGLDTSYDRRYGKEVGSIVNGYWRALPAALTNFTAAMDRGQAYTARGLEEQLTNKIKGGNRATTTMREWTDQLLKPLTATDAFFRTLTQGGEVMRQSYRQMKAQGMTDAQIDAEQIKLLQGPRSDYVKKFGEMETAYLAGGVQKQMEYRAFAQGLKDEDQLARSLQWLQNQPGGQLILPFVTTPYNAAKYDLERSPVGFAKALKDLALPPEQKIKVTGSVGKTLNAKLDTPDMTVGELSDRLSRGMAGSALFAALMTGVMTGRFDVNGPLPEAQDERDEWEAQGRKPYTIRIADRYASFQDVPGLNASLTTAALIKDIMNRSGDGDKQLPELIGKGILEATRSLAARPMAGGLLDLAQSIGSPGQTGASQVSSMLTPMLPMSGITRTVTTAMDKMQREQPVTAGEMLDRVYRPSVLPAKTTAWGDEMGNQNFGLPGVANPFRTTAANQFRSPTRYVTSDNAATDVAIGRAKAKVDAWKANPSLPIPSMDDLVNAQLATKAKDPVTAYERGAERMRAEEDKVRRQTLTMEDWLKEPVRR